MILEENVEISIDELINKGIISDKSINDYYQEYDYSNWIEEKGNYTPAINVKVVKRMKSGVYRIGINNDRVTCINVDIVSDDLFILPDSKTTFIMEEVKKFWDRKDKFLKHKMIHKRGILLEGPPGTGKTATITLLIEELIKLDSIIFIVNSAKDFSLIYDFYTTVIRKIEPDRNLITIIEDIDKIDNSGVKPELLDFLDGKMSINNHLLISTTNDSSELSDALLRPSRIDLRVLVDLPNEALRREFFIKKGVDEKDISEFVKKSENFSMSQLKEMFIGSYLLGNNIDQVVNQIKNPLAKQKYDSHVQSKTSIGF